jgi:LacI family transcriptional regulator
MPPRPARSPTSPPPPAAPSPAAPLQPGPETTLHDVARLAGVSPSTVSRILNGTARVAADKRQAVEQAIARLHFKPNLSARSLRNGSTRTVGVLTQELESPYFARGVRGLDEGLRGSGYAPIIVPGHWNPIEEAERMRLLIARRVDAIAILGGQLSDAEITEFARRQPIAVTDRSLQAPNVMSFDFDQFEGGRMATQHLIQLGHRRIAHIAGLKSQADAAKRKEGYLRAHADAGLPVEPRLIVEGNFVETGGVLAMNQLLDAQVPFTAVFCANDQTAWGARLALQRRGLRVPEDVSLVGFDDLPVSAFMSPPVTTVRQPVYEMGLAVAAALLQALGQPSGTPTGYPPLSLVVRESTRRL